MVANQIQNQAVRHELAAVHVPLGQLTQLRTLTPSRAQQISGGDVRCTQLVHEPDG